MDNLLCKSFRFLAINLALVLILFPVSIHAQVKSSDLELNLTDVTPESASKRIVIKAVVTNNGTSRVSRRAARKKFRLVITPPAGARYRSRSVSCKARRGKVRCKISALRSGRKATFKLRFRFSLECNETATLTGSITLPAVVNDPDTGNNSASLLFEKKCNEDPIVPSSGCRPLTDTIGTVHTVSSVSELRSAISSVNTGGNATILIRDGTYQIDQGFQVTGSNIIIRSQSGERDSVVIRGNGMTGSVTHGFWITGDDVTIADLSIGAVSQHPVQIQGDQDADRTWLHNLRIFNAGEQMVKGSYNSDSPSNYSNAGIVECCLFEYPSGIGPQWYIGGIDVHAGRNWIVRDNIFKGIRSPEDSLAEHAIHFWSNSEGTLVERNIIINCDRGIGFGLGNRGHSGGIIRNNFIYHDTSEGDVGIGLENAVNVKVLHNTIYFENDYPYAIEYRFSGTSAEIENNLTNQAIQQRDGGSATLSGNVTTAQSSWFKDLTSGDLHLEGSSIPAVDDQGSPISDVTADIDGETRSASSVDIGADER